MIELSVLPVRHTFRVPVSANISLDRFVYSYILCHKSIILIDTGVSGCEEKIFGIIKSIGRDPSEITTIVLTHSHPDHIGAARTIRERTGCCIAAHPAERS
jgi:hydroxyacylglutathione hydrolase